MIVNMLRFLPTAKRQVVEKSSDINNIRFVLIGNIWYDLKDHIISDSPIMGES